MPYLSDTHIIEKKIFSSHEKENDRKEEYRTKKDTFMLVNVSEVPTCQVMTAITRGYRQGLDYKQCLLSIFRLHNETINIWTHLLGFLFFSVLIVKDSLLTQEHIRDVSDYITTMLQLFGCQVSVDKIELFTENGAGFKLAHNTLL